jgi:chromosomal replication initiation ATPase DnaA
MAKERAEELSKRLEELARAEDRVAEILASRRLNNANASKYLRPSVQLVEAVTLRAAIEHGVEPADIMSERRLQKIAIARMTAWKRLRDLGYSLPSIGKAYNRDHTSILSGLRRLKKLGIS